MMASQESHLHAGWGFGRLTLRLESFGKDLYLGFCETINN